MNQKADNYANKIEELLYSKTNEKDVLKDILERRYAQKKFGHVLDIGTGPGDIVAYFASRTAQLTLVENLSEYEPQLKERFPKASIIIDSINNVPLSKDFDLILLSQCLYYFPEKEWLPLCKRMFDLLLAEGELVIVLNDHNSADLGKIFDRFLGELGEYAQFSYIPLTELKEGLGKLGKLEVTPYSYEAIYNSQEMLADVIARMALEISDEKILEKYRNDFLNFAAQFENNNTYKLNVKAELMFVKR